MLLVAGVCSGSLLTAGPMILSEWDGLSSPGGMRIMIALIIGLLMLPFALPAFWWTSLPRILLGTFVPSIIAAIACAQAMDKDYTYLLVGVPVMMGSGLLMSLLLPTRQSAAGRGFCHVCAYDVRVATDSRCPECGIDVDEAAQQLLPARRHRRWLLIGLIGFLISVTLQWLFIRFLLSLG